MGQWYSEKRVDHNDDIEATFPQYKEQLITGTQNWKILNVDFYFRKIHYKSPGDIITACQPMDHFYPMVIDGYNEII